MILSPHFALVEFTRTSTGQPNTPDGPATCALRALCSAVLEPWRERVGPLRVSSGFRSHRVNEALRELGYAASRTSQHLVGEAADVVPVRGRAEAWLTLVEMVEAGLPVDQAIIYEDQPHVHVSHTARWTARREVLVHLARPPDPGRPYVAWGSYRGPLRG